MCRVPIFGVCGVLHVLHTPKQISIDWFGCSCCRDLSGQVTFLSFSLSQSLGSQRYFKQSTDVQPRSIEGYPRRPTISHDASVDYTAQSSWAPGATGAWGARGARGARGSWGTTGARGATGATTARGARAVPPTPDQKPGGGWAGDCRDLELSGNERVFP